MKELSDIRPLEILVHTKMKPMVSIEDLPDPIVEYILGYLSPYRDLKRCMQVNKSWHRFVCAVIRKMQRDFLNAVCHMSVLWNHMEADHGPTITKRYSHSACCSGNSMYIFGGCTTANTTFNDLWRLDLGTRCWIRPLATGTYPPPKACATLVSDSDNLILFGGWTHTAPYPLHQVWRVFNQIHIYNTTTNRWTQITATTNCPPMAGHSATVHGDFMVVYGGVQKQSCDGPFVSTSDIWILDLRTYQWQKRLTHPDAPPPRYGHSQIYIDKNHLLIMGGCGGPNMLYTDIWLLDMTAGLSEPWKWTRMDIHDKENAAPQIAFHPACKVGTQVIVMSKSHRSRSSLTSLPNLLRAPSRTWMPPRLEEEDSASTRNAKRSASEIEPCVNGKRGVLKRPSERRPKPAPMSSSDEEEPSDVPRRISMQSFPLPPRNGTAAAPDLPSTSGTLPKSAANGSESGSPPGPSSQQSGRDGGSPTKNPAVGPQGSRREDGRQGAVNPHARRNRQRQLEGLDRMEQRLKELRAGNASHPVVHKTIRPTRRPLCMYVLDISSVFDGHVTWRAISHPSPSAPDEIILYSLVLGKGEVIMFGGIQKDLNSSDQEGEAVPEIVSNSLHFMTAERVVI